MKDEKNFLGLGEEGKVRISGPEGSVNVVRKWFNEQNKNESSIGGKEKKNVEVEDYNSILVAESNNAIRDTITSLLKEQLDFVTAFG